MSSGLHRVARCVIAAVGCFAAAAAPLSAQLISRGGAGGAVAAVGRGWQPQLALDGELVTPAFDDFRATLHGSFARAAAPSAVLASEMIAGVRISSVVGQGGIWLGGDIVRRRATVDAVERPRLTSGAWRRIGDVVVTLSASRRAARFMRMTYVDRAIAQPPLIRDSLGKIDTVLRPDLITRDSASRADMHRWAETEAALLWERRRWSASVAVGGRLASRGVPGGVWTSADMAVAFAPSLSLVLGGSVAPGARYFPASEHRYITIGLRVAPRFFRSRAVPAPSAPAPTAFAVVRAGDGVYRLALRVPRARRVELSGDFTGWKPVALQREHGDEWSVTLPLGVGAHRLNVRIDGGAWIAPPGVMTTSDDFAGEVGLVVVDAPRGAEPK